MRRSMHGLLAVVVVAVIAAIMAPVPVTAHDYDRDDEGHPLRIIAYLLHPIGIGLEYGPMRGIHWVVSQPHARIIFGHAPRHELNEQGQLPVCNACKPLARVVTCPHCNKPLLKPRDEYYVWR